jgi:hypothetical protein
MCCSCQHHLPLLLLLPLFEQYAPGNHWALL